MWGTLQQQSFLIGAVLVLIYQAAKFSQFNVTDPATNRYIALLPGTSVRDFSGPYAYHIALGAFLAASLVAYFVVCSISPEVLSGAGKLFGAPDAAKMMEGVPYPLYVAALFMGLTQPVIPLLSKVADAQRDFFHDRIAVPKRLIDVSESLVGAIEARAGSNKKLLTAELRHLAGAEFIAGLRGHGDMVFYRQQLESLGIDDEGGLARVIRESSPRDLRDIIRRLVLGALIAAMRQSGPQALTRVAQALDAPNPQHSRRDTRFLVASVISSGVLFSITLLIVANVLWLLNEPVSGLFGRTAANSLWPEDLSGVGEQLLTIVPSIFICLLIAVSVLVPREHARHAASTNSLLTDFVEFFRASASVLGGCIVVAIAIKVGQLFYEYNTFLLPSEVRSPSRLVLPVIQSFIPVSLSLFTAWYLVSAAGERNGPSFVVTLAMITGSTALISWLYSMAFVTAFLHQNPEYAPAREYVLFGVAANVLVSVCAFASVTLFFKARRRLPEVEQPRRRRARTGQETDKRGLRRLYNGVRTRIAAEHRAQP